VLLVSTRINATWLIAVGAVIGMLLHALA
jgi:hypothetical protein